MYTYNYSDITIAPTTDVSAGRFLGLKCRLERVPVPASSRSTRHPQIDMGVFFRENDIVNHGKTIGKP